VMYVGLFQGVMNEGLFQSQFQSQQSHIDECGSLSGCDD